MLEIYMILNSSTITSLISTTYITINEIAFV